MTLIYFKIIYVTCMYHNDMNLHVGHSSNNDYLEIKSCVYLSFQTCNVIQCFHQHFHS